MTDEQLGFDFQSPAPDRDRETRLSSPAQGGGAAPAGPVPEPATGPPPGLPAPEGRDHCLLVRSLADVAARHPIDRKTLVCRTRGEGRELLRQLAVASGAWLGFEVTTLRPLALEVAGASLAREGVDILDEFDEQALLDEAIDAVLVARDEGRFTELSDGVGFRRAVGEAIRALRLAGIDPGRIDRSALDDARKKRVLASLHRTYESLLAREGRTDTAGVLGRAAAILEGPDGAAALEGQRIILMPGLHRRGLSGRVLAALEALGAERLATDPVKGLSPPESIVFESDAPTGALSFLHAPASAPATPAPAVDVFAGASVSDELREVLRRVTEAGLAWDQVEIVTPDPQVYGSELHALSERLGIPVTFGVGLPVERTRPGRVVDAYFSWLEGGFGADVIRTLLQNGDLRAPPPLAHITGSALARRFRELRIGWGRERYLTGIDDVIEALAGERPHKRESPERFQKRIARKRRELEALRRILGPVLARTPPVPDRLQQTAPPVSPSRLAGGLRALLDRVASGTSVDDTARERIARVLDRIRATLDRETEYRAAAAIVRGYLEFRVPAPRAEGKAPWSSAGGHLYLTDLEHGGMTGRPATFVVGLDATRFPGAGLQDPLLLDAERWTLGKGTLPTSHDRLQERLFQLAAMVARLRGRVTFSFAAWNPADARLLPPAPELLQAYRLMCRDPDRTFEDLRGHLGAAAGVIPRGEGRLDGQDVWFAALTKDVRLLDGQELVRRAFGSLDAGLRAADLQAGDVVTAHHGQVTPRPELDPRLNPSRVMSASGLSDLGACPLRFLYGRVLDVYPPDDPVLDPERWLDNLQRGSLLHRVFERALRGARRDGIEPGEAAFLDRALEVLYDEAALALRTIPSPSDAVRLRELGRLADDVRSFVEMVRADDPDWVALELAFGFRGEAPMLIETPGGSVPLRGAVDRVDRRPDGLVVIDYKTGSTWQFGSKSGTYDGGRRLQHVLYSAVAAALLGEPVSAMEYHFPTRRGENRRAVFPMRRLRTAGELLDRLMDLMAGGHFLPTDDPDDCRFCNYQGACRVSVDRYNTVESPRAEWRKAHPDVPEARIHRRVRGWDDEGDGFLAAAGDAVPLAARRAPAEEVDPEAGDPDAGSDPSDPSLPARGRP